MKREYPMPNTRIRDVAKHAGVSEATITRVINKKGYVSEETREKVLNSIAALDYIPNRMASALKNRRTGIIVNALPLSLYNPFFSNIAVALKSAALKFDYQILPLYHEQDRNLEDRLLKLTVSCMAEGIIFSGDIHPSRKAVKEILNKGTPIIMIERPMRISGIDKVLLDDYYGSSEAAKKILSMGHRNPGFIGMDLKYNNVELNRFNGYKQTLKKNGVNLNENSAVFIKAYEAECGYEAMNKIIKKSRRPTACFITSDTLVCGALQYLYDAGLRVPEDISIIGYDNTLSSLCSPPITSVAVPYDEIGTIAISLFRERREQKRSFDKVVTLSPFIFDRGSVADLRKNKR